MSRLLRKLSELCCLGRQNRGSLLLQAPVLLKATRLQVSKLQATILCLCMGMVLPVSAIVTRHDTGYSRFLARESDFPAVFPLHIDQQRKTCVATLINERWAVTAAHCAAQTPLQQQLQEHGSYAVTIAGQQFYVDKLVFHPGWSEVANNVFVPDQIDMALLRLDAAVTHAAFVPLYAGDTELGQILMFLGWGYSGVGSTGISANDGRLRFARNRVNTAGQQLYFRFNDPQSPDSAAVEFEGIPGLGDSGGPALLTEDGLTWLAGIAVGELESDTNSLLKQSGGRYGATVVYERVSLHIDWIMQVIAAEQPDNQK